MPPLSVATRTKRKRGTRSSSHPALTAGFVAPLITRYFEALDVSATLVFAGQHRRYRPIHRRSQWPDPLSFEYKSDAYARRMNYNDRQLAKAERAGKLVVGRHGLFVDLFVPVVTPAGTLGSVVAGPLLAEAPTANLIASEFERLRAVVRACVTRNSWLFSGHPGHHRAHWRVARGLRALLDQLRGAARRDPGARAGLRDLRGALGQRDGAPVRRAHVAPSKRPGRRLCQRTLALRFR